MRYALSVHGTSIATDIPPLDYGDETLKGRSPDVNKNLYLYHCIDGNPSLRCPYRMHARAHVFRFAKSH